MQDVTNLLKKRGRKALPWDEKAEKTKQEEILAFCRELKSMPKEKVLRSVIKMLNETGEKDLAAILSTALKKPERVTEIRKKLKTEEKSCIPLTRSDALALLLDCRLTKNQYKTLKDRVNACGYKVLPCYEYVTRAKEECRPIADAVTISERSACVKLQALLSHTVQRIVRLSGDYISTRQSREKIGNEKLTLMCSYGFDGSTGQSNYKQAFETEQETSCYDDSSLFVTTLTPLLLKSEDGLEYWRNSTPQSTRFCRPVRMLLAKESKALVLSEDGALKLEIQNLQNVSIVLDNGNTLDVSFKLLLTVIDGKVLSILTGVASSMCCPICGARPNEFNSLLNLDQSVFAPKEGALLHGVSALHCWIRFFELILHLAYRLPFKSWRINSEFKLAAKERKLSIQAKFWSELSLRVDYPCPGGSGTSNDGNTARRAFANYKTLARVLEVDEKLVLGLRTILIAFGSQLPIDHEKFKSHCHPLLAHYLSLYAWFKLPASVHKVLVHGADIIRTCALPVGMVSEEGAECRNKLYRQDRERHTRKMTRTLTMHDLFYRAMDSWDPFISSGSMTARKSLQKREPLPADVVSMLVLPEDAVNNVVEESSETDMHLDHDFADRLDQSDLDGLSEFEEV